MNDGGMTATVLHLGEESLKSMGSLAFADLSYLFFLLLSFLVPSTSGLAALSMPIMAPIAEFAGVGRELVVTEMCIRDSALPVSVISQNKNSRSILYQRAERLFFMRKIKYGYNE